MKVRLAGVGAADDRHARRPHLGLGQLGEIPLGQVTLVDRPMPPAPPRPAGRREAVHHHVEEVAGAAAVLCADRDGRLEAEGVELGPLVLAPRVVRLVDDQDRRLAGAPQAIGHLVVERRDAGGGIHHEQDEVRLLDRHPCLVLHPLLDVAPRLELQAAGVDHGEAPAVPLADAVDAVAGGAGDVLDDRDALPDQPVEEGRLADVGAADDGDHGKGHVPSVRVAWPGCGLGSWEPGWPAWTASPSRPPSGRRCSSAWATRSACAPASWMRCARTRAWSPPCTSPTRRRRASRPPRSIPTAIPPAVRGEIERLAGLLLPSAPRLARLLPARAAHRRERLGDSDAPATGRRAAPHGRGERDPDHRPPPRLLVGARPVRGIVVPEILDEAFPPDLPDVRHASINSLAAGELRRRRGIESMVVPNVFDFDQPQPPHRRQVRNRMRARAGHGRLGLLVVQPTRVVPRKGIELAIELVGRLGDPRLGAAHHLARPATRGSTTWCSSSARPSAPGSGCGTPPIGSSPTTRASRIGPGPHPARRLPGRRPDHLSQPVRGLRQRPDRGDLLRQAGAREPIPGLRGGHRAAGPGADRDRRRDHRCDRGRGAPRPRRSGPPGAGSRAQLRDRARHLSYKVLRRRLRRLLGEVEGGVTGRPDAALRSRRRSGRGPPRGRPRASRSRR